MIRPKNIFVGLALFAAPMTYSQGVSMPCVETQNSGCLGYWRSAAPDVEDYDDPYEMRFSTRYDSGLLTVRIENIFMDCCADGVETTLLRDGNDLYFNAHESYIVDESGFPAMCDCICPYNVGGVFEGIEPGEYTLHIHDWDGSRNWTFTVSDGMSHNLIPGVATGVGETSASDFISICGKNVTVSGIGRMCLALYDTSGTRIALFEDQDGMAISLAGLPKGIYLLRANVAGHIVTRKINL